MEIELKLSILLIMFSLLLGTYACWSFPEIIASHWGLSGESNGYLPRIFGAFLLPLIMILIFVLFLGLPRLDPLRANIEAFKTSYHRFVFVLTSFLFLVYLQTILWNLGTKISFTLTMPILLGGLFFYSGVLLEKTKRNWFIGIRTPWTLSSNEVWDKTHQFGSKVFKIAGVLMLFALVIPAYSFFIIVGVALVAALGTVIYSYVAYAELRKKA
ncbi:SdpI family protein [Candidatus Micrarchaeota archaeon]|nr:SdpI family protein [Candidatus Micrarchaeota archaeon]